MKFDKFKKSTFAPTQSCNICKSRNLHIDCDTKAFLWIQPAMQVHIK